MSQSHIGLIGLAVMGQNLVLNMERNGYRVAVYNRTTKTMREFTNAHPGKNIQGCETLEELVAALDRPRKIMLMVKAGSAVDAVIEQLAAPARARRPDHRRRQLVLHGYRAQGAGPRRPGT